MKIKNFFNKLRVRLTLCLLIIAFLPSCAIGTVSYINSIKELEKHDTAQLVFLRDSKKKEIESYFNTNRNQLSFMAQNTTTIDAMKDFSNGFQDIKKDLNVGESQFKAWNEELRSYYNETYFPALEKNLYNVSNKDSYYPANETSVSLQHLYISGNSNGVNDKIKLDAASDTSNYSKFHQKYHSTFVSFANKFQYDDLLLVDFSTSDIVYSTSKKMDFATNLLNGPYKNSNLAKAFTTVKNSGDKNFTAIVDFDFFDPSFHMPVAFIGAPIYDGNKKLGVLLIQLHSDKLNEILTSNGEYASLGLGKTGDITLVGQDSKLRSNLRLWQEETDPKIKAMQTTMLLKEVSTDSSQAALNGKTGSNIFKDYRNVSVLTTYTPLNIDSLKWGLVTKIDVKEAFSGSEKLKNTMIVIMSITLFIVVLLCLFIALSISSPLIKLAKITQAVSNGDLTVETPSTKRSDEIGILTLSVSDMITAIRLQTKEIGNVVNTLASSTSQISASLTQVTSGAAETSSAVSETTATVEEVKQTVYVSTQKTKHVSLKAQESAQIAQVGKKSTEETLEGMNNINTQMEAIAESILVLSEKSQDIGELITTVDTLAEQSNLLAVNASIEAAKALEHGKGFAVVAQEIRNLADQSKQATKQVRTILKDIQKATSTAVMTTEQGMKVVETSMHQALEAGNSVHALADTITIAAQATTQIEASSQQQLVGMDQIALAMDGVKQASYQNVDSMKQLENASRDLQDMGQRLKDLINHFNF